MEVNNMFKSIWNWFTGADQKPAIRYLGGSPHRDIEMVAPVLEPEKTVKKHTKASLSKLTKADLEQVGRKDFGIELDRRKKKDELVADLLKAQKG